MHREARRPVEAIASYQRATRDRGVPGRRPSRGRSLPAQSGQHLHPRWASPSARPNRLDEALASYQKARDSLNALVAANPSVTDYRYELAGSLNNIANLQRARVGGEEALRTHRQALEIRQALVAANPRVVRYQVAMAASFNAIAIVQAKLGRREDSLRTLREFRDRMRAVLADDPKNGDARIWLGNAPHNMGNVLLGLGRPAEAVSAFEEAIEQTRLLLAEGPTTKGRLRFLGSHYRDLAEAQRAVGRPAEAAATLREHRELWDNDPAELYDLACGLAQCIPLVAKGHAEPTPQQLAEREKYGDWSMDALRRAVAAGFRDPAKIREDADFAPLRARRDFVALVTGLELPDEPFARPK